MPRLIVCVYLVSIWYSSVICFDVVEFVIKNGYPFEAHVNIVTKDGYLLDIMRIPHGRNNKAMGKRPVVFLMHGIYGNAENWIIAGPNRALSFQLADRGYDVWLGNSRGSTHSRKHIKLNPDVDPQYWLFGWHEIGIYDLPAMIDYILDFTNETDLYYVGHSQGTTTFFVLESEIPQYHKRIKAMIALSPIAYMGHVPQPYLKAFINFDDALSFLTNVLGVTEYIPNRDFVAQAGEELCQEKAITNELCENMIFFIVGYDSAQTSKKMVGLMTSSLSPSVSIRQLQHFNQLMKSGKFQKFDYGRKGNFEKYGSYDPPLYKLKYIKTPVVFFYAANDGLASLEDVENLFQDMPAAKIKYLVPYRFFNHLDFLYAKDVVKLVYSKIYTIFGKLQNGVSMDDIEPRIY